MAASDHLPGNSDRDRPSSEISTRCLREQSQRDFEVEFIGRILDRDPYYVDALRVQANNLARRGESTRALQLDRRLTRLQPDRPIPWYNLACSYAVLGMIDPAFDALNRAVDLGYHHFRHMLRDPDLNALRQDPRFARILRRG
jgi:tetratricopeptide (TPR) repeat protein